MPKIESIVTERVLVPLRPEWTIKGGRGTHDRSPFLLIRVRSEGVEGLGEVSGTYLWSGEGFETAEAAVSAVLRPALTGKELAPRVVRREMDRVLAAFPFTKAGVEMACWDALGKICGVSVATLLGGPIRSFSRFEILNLWRCSAGSGCDCAAGVGGRVSQVQSQGRNWIERGSGTGGRCPERAG